MTTMNSDLQQIVQEAHGAPVQLRDPATNEVYVLLKEETYNRLRAVFESDDLSREEKLSLLAASGERAGWNDPAMDIYDDYNRHRQ